MLTPTRQTELQCRADQWGLGDTAGANAVKCATKEEKWRSKVTLPFMRCAAALLGMSKNSYNPMVEWEGHPKTYQSTRLPFQMKVMCSLLKCQCVVTTVWAKEKSPWLVIESCRRHTWSLWSSNRRVIDCKIEVPTPWDLGAKMLAP